MFKRVKIKTGDQVKVISGASKGKEGRVLEVIRKTDQLIIDGVNMITKHVKPSATNPEGGIENTEAPIHISNVMFIDNQGNATRVGRRRDENGKLVRYSIKTGEVI